MAAQRSTIPGDLCPGAAADSVVYHAANNAFLHWKAYNDMIGLGWRTKSIGLGLAVSEDDKIVIIPVGAGPGTWPSASG